MLPSPATMPDERIPAAPAPRAKDGRDQSPTIPTSKPTAWVWWTAAIVLLIAAAIRVISGLGDLAIDEIWSWWNVQRFVSRMSDCFMLRHDNNHLLNTLIIYALGPAAPDFVYRLPAVCASIASVSLAGMIAQRREGGVARLIAMIVFGASSLLVLYGSEARGYSYAVFFALLSWLLLLRVDERRNLTDVLAFAVSASLGFLGHLTFLYCFAGFFAWAVLRWIRQPTWQIPLAFVLPTSVAAGLYLFFIRGMAIGGGPETTLESALITTLSLVAGGPLYDDGALVSALIVALILGLGFLHLWFTDRSLFAGYFTSIVLAPSVVLILTGHQLVYPRYFLIPVTFALLLITDILAHWWQIARRPGRMGLVTLLLLFLSGNGLWLADLFRHGRGDYSHAVKWMADQSQRQPATVSSDHDFRNGLIFGYYAARLWPSNPRLIYVDQQRLQRQSTDWIIRHNFDGDPPFPELITDPGGHSYQLQQTFLHHSLTGWNWWIYRHVAR